MAVVIGWRHAGAKVADGGHRNGQGRHAEENDDAHRLMQRRFPWIVSAIGIE